MPALLARRLAAALVLALAQVLLAAAALARAGGGGGYSGGSSGGGSSSGGFSSGGGRSGGGGGDLGVFDLLMIAAVIGFAIWSQVQQRKREAERRLAARERARELTARLRDGDAPFDAPAFLDRAELAFRKVQRAWSQQDLGPVRAFLSDGVQERFGVQLQEQRELGYRNPVSDVVVQLAEIVEVRSDAHFDHLAVRFTVRATDLRVRLETLDEIPGSRRRERFVEIWSFVRGRGAVPNGDGGLIESRCPSCGAPIDPGLGWRCPSCSSRLRGSPRDWVLSEITQQAEWRAGRGDGLPGLKAHQERDPGFTVPNLEDRASVLFWRKLDADRRGSARSLGSVARPEFLAEHAARLLESGRTFLGDCAVGSVELLGLLPGEAWDRALLEVRWEGSFFDREASDPPRNTGRRSVRRSLMVLARRAGVASDLSECIATAHCPRCGAPDAGSEEGACSWCGTALNDGTRGWLLDAFHPWDADEAGALRVELGPREAAAPDPATPLGAGLFAWALHLARADGGLGAGERLLLRRLARRIGLSPRSARALLEVARQGRLEPELPAAAEEAEAWLAELVALAVVDGRPSPLEQRLLWRLARRARVERPALEARLAARSGAATS